MVFWNIFRATMLTAMIVCVLCGGAIVFGDVQSAPLIAYTVLTDRNRDIALLDPNTQIHYNLTQSSAIDWNFTPAPDGESFYFISDRTGIPLVYQMSVNTREIKLMNDRLTHINDPIMSPDGEKLLYLRNRVTGMPDVYIWDLDDEPFINLSNDDTAVAADAIWGVDSETVFFASRLPSEPSRIYQVSIANPQPIALTEARGGDFAPAISSNGQWLAYVQGRALEDGRGMPTLLHLPTQSTTLITLPRPFQHSSFPPMFSPDNQQLLLQIEDDALWIYDVLLAELQYFPLPVQVIWTQWSSDGDQILVHGIERNQPKIYLYDIATQQLISVSPDDGVIIQTGWIP